MKNRLFFASSDRRRVCFSLCMLLITVLINMSFKGFEKMSNNFSPFVFFTSPSVFFTAWRKRRLGDGLLFVCLDPGVTVAVLFFAFSKRVRKSVVSTSTETIGNVVGRIK